MSNQEIYQLVKAVATDKGEIIKSYSFGIGDKFRNIFKVTMFNGRVWKTVEYHKLPNEVLAQRFRDWL